MCVVGNDTADFQGVAGIGEGAQGNCLCVSEVWPVHAIRKVGIEGFGCLSREQEGKGLRRQGWHTEAYIKHRQPVSNQLLTWSTFSKNHAGRWLVSATSCGKWRMALRLKGLICVNLENACQRLPCRRVLSSPFVEYLDPARINNIHYVEQVFQDILQDSNFEFVQQIHDQVGEQVEAQG